MKCITKEDYDVWIKFKSHMKCGIENLMYCCYFGNIVFARIENVMRKTH